MKMKRRLSMLLAVVMVVSLFAAVPLTASAETDHNHDEDATVSLFAHAGTGTGAAAVDVKLFTMYKGAYMNYLAYSYLYPTETSAPSSGLSEIQKLQAVKFEFPVANSGKTVANKVVAPATGSATTNSSYDVIPLTWLTSNSTVTDSKFVEGTSGATYKTLTSYSAKTFYHNIKGDRNGNVAVFTSGPLKGLIVYPDVGTLLIAGFVNADEGVAADYKWNSGTNSGDYVDGTDSTNANPDLSLARIVVNIDETGTKDAGTKKQDVTFTFKFATTGDNGTTKDSFFAPTIEKDWLDTPSRCAISHGYATITDTKADCQYQVKVSDSEGTKFPGNDGTLIVPFMGTTKESEKNEYVVKEFTPSETTISNSTYSVPFVHGGSSYGDGSGELSFQKACMMLSDGGTLVLTISKEDTAGKTINEILGGTFGHLIKPGCMAISNNDTQFQSYNNDGSDGSDEPVLTVASGNKIIPNRVGYAISYNIVEFFPAGAGCTFWNGNNGTDKTFSASIMIKVLGLSFDTHEDGQGGTTGADAGAKYYVQKLVKGSTGWEWETLSLASSNPGVGVAMLTDLDGDSGLVIADDGLSFTVGKDKSNIDITNIELGTGYRVVCDINNVEDYSAFFTPPENVEATIDISGTATITVDQEYGVYNPSTDVYQEYQLQVLQDGVWVAASKWYTGLADATGAADTTIPSLNLSVETKAPAGSNHGQVIFSNLPETNNYRIVSCVAADTGALSIGGDSYTIKSSVVKREVKASDDSGDNVNQFDLAGPAITIPVTLDGVKSSNSALPTITFVKDGGAYSTDKISNGAALVDTNTTDSTGTRYYIYEDGIKTDSYVVIVKDTSGSTPTYTTTYGNDSDTSVDTAPNYDYFTVTVDDGGNIDKSEDFGILSGSDYLPSVIVKKGNEITVAATGEGEYTNVTWTTSDGSSASVSSDGKITVNGALNLVATATKPVTNVPNPGIIVNNPGGGTITGTDGIKDLKPGEEKTVTITADSDKKLLDVVVDGESAKNKMKGNDLTIAGDDNVSKIDVIFTDKGNAIVTQVTAKGGSMTLNAETTEDKSTTGKITAHKPGTNASITFTPEEGYYLRNVTINGVTYGAQEVLEIEITDDMEIVPLFSAIIDLNYDDHYAYMIGYDDGLVHPGKEITREEAATIFFRLLSDESREIYLSKTNSFTDVESTRWSNCAISTLTGAGIITGKTATTFEPSSPITRAELVVIASRFTAIEYAGSDLLSDIGGHWAQAELNNAANKGWISGYDGSLFLPDRNITRAEAVTLINNVLNRKINSNQSVDWVTWDDNVEGSWYYMAIQEASNSHHYERGADGFETWTSMRENRDWTEFER